MCRIVRIPHGLIEMCLTHGRNFTEIKGIFTKFRLDVGHVHIRTHHGCEGTRGNATATIITFVTVKEVFSAVTGMASITTEGFLTGVSD